MLKKDAHRRVRNPLVVAMIKHPRVRFRDRRREAARREGRSKVDANE